MESILADDTFARLPITKYREEIPFPQRTGRLCSNVVLIYRAPWYSFQYGGGVRKESSWLLLSVLRVCNKSSLFCSTFLDFNLLHD